MLKTLAHSLWGEHVRIMQETINCLSIPVQASSIGMKCVCFCAGDGGVFKRSVMCLCCVCACAYWYVLTCDVDVIAVVVHDGFKKHFL